MSSHGQIKECLIIFMGKYLVERPLGRPDGRSNGKSKTDFIETE
jgi:hypothetical protein